MRKCLIGLLLCFIVFKTEAQGDFPILYNEYRDSLYKWNPFKQLIYHNYPSSQWPIDSTNVLLVDVRKEWIDNQREIFCKRLSKDSLVKFERAFNLDSLMERLQNVNVLVFTDGEIGDVKFANALLKLKNVKIIDISISKKSVEKRIPSIVKDFDNATFLLTDHDKKYKMKDEKLQYFTKIKILSVLRHYPIMLLDIPNIEELCININDNIPDISRYKKLKYLYLSSCKPKKLSVIILKCSNIEYLKINEDIDYPLKELEKLASHPTLNIIDFYFENKKFSYEELKEVYMMFKDKGKKINFISVRIGDWDYKLKKNIIIETKIQFE